MAVANVLQRRYGAEADVAIVVGGSAHRYHRLAGSVGRALPARTVSPSWSCPELDHESEVERHALEAMTATEPSRQNRDLRRGVDGRRVLGQARARLVAISHDLADAAIDAGDLQRDAEELSEVADHIQSLVDGSATSVAPRDRAAAVSRPRAAG